MTDKPRPGEELELLVTKSAYGGDGIALLGGKVYFVDGALPGERVLARVTTDKKNFSRANVVRILESSPHRVAAPCLYASHCGGCQYQHVDYAEELRLKESQLLEIFQAIPGIEADKINPIVASDREYGYRNSVTLHPVFFSSKETSAKKIRPARLGFISKDNTSRIPVKSCLIADPKLAPVFGKEYPLKQGTDKITFKLSENGEIIPDTEEIFFRVRLGGKPFLVSSQGFFQNNLYVARLLAAKIAQWAGQIRPDAFFDLYAGVGTFSFLSAPENSKIVCLEESPASVQAMRMNREEQKMSRLEIVEGRVERTFPQIWEKERTDRSFVLLDPPRQGVTADLAQFLSKKEGAKSLAYISCDPATLARDLKIILSQGAWDVREVAPYDMFPRTKHIEVAVLLINK